ncbi:cleavage and polyadenylation specificity factor subunit 2 [Cichlidogyrus casuarinus]|uniref:Cleavage and polyadenylation specificity factor subunit 2 n=1 Tax=Cichlidogyrus casuarinus TaxID=1844966 RepID=A0ABD2Q2Y5_9PLAT
MATANMVSKCISQEMELTVRCALHLLDYEGRSDGEAVKKIVAGLRPQELILVGGDKEGVTHLASYCGEAHSCLVHAPLGLDLVNCTKEGDIYQARMSDALMNSLQLTRIKDYELAWVTAQLEIQRMQEKRQNEAENLPVLVPTASRMEEDHETVFVNEPKLSDLKQILVHSGLRAEFVSGTLMVNECVAIKRTEARKFVLEGSIGLTFLRVRNILYQQFAIL